MGALAQADWLRVKSTLRSVNLSLVVHLFLQSKPGAVYQKLSLSTLRASPPFTCLAGGTCGRVCRCVWVLLLGTFHWLFSNSKCDPLYIVCLVFGRAIACLHVHGFSLR